ncbi:voltage-dependent calcium channel subunit alpha-2/delta-4-like isoform X1 [Bombyx mandarina]|uniref:Voltage-dependent calcium channel subunit alpha-2/delta-4-like isoform X1 n=1 Tax=Bombyx mandarina TaxID=7092 RepID=A0A6J2JYR2_BOMMA|nr:voltage-dependent calcium channel subunit alpha-2/delta-4-like isoform X1 [Bombyx mandarina]
MRCLKLTILLVLFLTPDPVPAWRADIVKTWARNLGEEIWRLSEALTKSDQIRIKYKQMNASVKKKDGKQILESSLRSVSTMLTRKINAVKCIHETAIQIARNFNYVKNASEIQDFTYCSAKYSNFTYEIPGDKPVSDEKSKPKFTKNNPHYTTVSLVRDSHFYDINVNTNHSCVHVPTNIFYLENNVFNAIEWSKELNQVFTKNYQSDPSLSWQYFGSSHGVLRFYPGMPWNTKEVDTYDCRVMSWYIEAATCSKDVIILFDISGSMTGFKNYVARRTLRSLLDTLSNNDYVNVYKFNDTVTEVVKCFKGLVQATPENLKTITATLEPFVDAEGHLKPNVPLAGNANLTAAFVKAFDTLKERRKQCNVSSTQGCNQLIMVITDYVAGNLSDVFEKYNRVVVNGKTYTPVRVFTYLIGKEVTNVPEIEWMACSNRGYFVHIHSVEEVQQQVLKYINVIALPMILVAEKPPPTWTHANIDYTRTAKWDVSGDIDKPGEDKLVTSVAIPAFDFKKDDNSSNARLLGVAGTDVPIDSIAKLAQPHQLGVNGYSFIVSNNGYLLLHPLLITSINGNMQDNYNSVDFVEVEQVDDGKGSRELGEQIKKLRASLVDGEDGYMKEVKVLYHYDNMRRIARVEHDYFFNRLVGTPFSMGISLPKGYGDTELLLKDNPLEAKQGKALTGINVTDYFKFSYRVHPDWVYCKYHYLEGHESENVELEVWKFLVRISHNDLNITEEQYMQETAKEVPWSIETHCGNATRELGVDDYYCNEDLVKQLVFDAKLTTPYFENWDATNEEINLAKKYNVSVRFIATASGLTRWHYINDKTKNEKVNDTGYRHKEYKGKVFGDIYFNAIEENWYKAAVLQHMINKESLVISTPLPILDDIIQNKPPVQNEDGDITVTSTYAIFYKDGESETPASVVGFEYSYLSFYDRFMEITNVSWSGSREVTCSGEDYDCYLIDSSGYIVLSKDKEEVGQFFGIVNKYVLQSFLDQNIFQHVEVFDYQALCPIDILPEKNNSWSLVNTFTLVGNILRWLLVETLFLLSNVYNWKEYYVYGEVMEIYETTEEPTTTAIPPLNNGSEAAKEPEENPFSCDHIIKLFILNQTYFSEAMGASPVVYKDEPGECHPAYWASLVKKTNLLLVVVKTENKRYPETCKEPPNTKPRPTSESTASREPCHKLDLGALHRRRLEDCFTYHDEERHIMACDHANILATDSIVLGILASIAILSYKTYL